MSVFNFEFFKQIMYETTIHLFNSSYFIMWVALLQLFYTFKGEINQEIFVSTVLTVPTSFIYHPFIFLLNMTLTCIIIITVVGHITLL